MKKIVFLCLLLKTFCLALPDSSSSAIILDDKYNLGRIVGKAFMNEMSFYPLEGTSLFVDGIHYQNGKNDVCNIGETFLGGLVFSEGGGGLLFGIPELDFNAAIGSQNRISCAVLPTNLEAFIGNGGTSGFESPFYMVNAYKWDYLSRKGNITLSQDQMENAFYFKPLVNQGQLRFTTDVIHSIGRIGYYTPGILNIFPALSFGILDNVQLSGMFHYINHKSSSYYDIENYYPYYSQSNLFERDTLIALGKIDYRTNSLSMQYGYRFLSDKVNDSIINRRHTIFVDAAYILGKHITSGRQVLGNWDGYFSSMLGSGQLLVQARMEYELKGNSSDTKMLDSEQILTPAGLEYELKRNSSDTNFSFQNGIHYGLMKYCTIGEKSGIKCGKYMKPSYNVALDAVVMNVPVRENGPSQVSSFEYLYGYQLKKGQLRAECSLHLPIQKQIISMYEIPSLLEYESYFGVTFTNRDIQSDPISELDWTREQPVGSKLKNNDLFIKISAGITDNVIISNSFESLTDHYRASIYDEYLNQPEGIFKNTIYSDSFGLSILKDNRGIFTILASIIGQTDKHVSGSERHDFLFSGLYQGAF